MNKEAFNRVIIAGSLTWEQKNPINFVYYPLEREDTNTPKVPENTQQIEPIKDEQKGNQQK